MAIFSLKVHLLQLSLADPAPSKAGPGGGLIGMEIEPECSLVVFEVALAALSFFTLLQAAASFERLTVENVGHVKLQKWCS